MQLTDSVFMEKCYQEYSFKTSKNKRLIYEM